MQTRERAGGGTGRDTRAQSHEPCTKFFFFLFFFDIVIWQTGNVWEARGRLPVRRHRRHGGKTASAGSGKREFLRRATWWARERRAHVFLVGSKQVFPLSSSMQLQYPTSEQLHGLSGDVTTSKPQEEDTTSEDKSKKWCITTICITKSEMTLFNFWDINVLDVVGLPGRIWVDADKVMRLYKQTQQGQAKKKLPFPKREAESSKKKKNET